MPSVVVHSKLQLINDCFLKLSEDVKDPPDSNIAIIGEEIFLAEKKGIDKRSFEDPTLLFACEFRPYLIHFYQEYDLQGILLGSYSSKDFIEAILAVSNGGQFLRPDLLKRMYQLDLPRAYAKVDSLTKTERQVTQLILGGYDNDGVAAELGCKRRTAESHKYRIYKKLHVDSSIRLQLFASDYCPWLLPHSI